MSSRPPFVSGLPGGDLLGEVAPAAGLEVLGTLRTRARRRADELAPLCARRFDGSENIPADAEAIAEKAECDALVALVDAILADCVLKLRVCAFLARRARP